MSRIAKFNSVAAANTAITAAEADDEVVLAVSVVPRNDAGVTVYVTFTAAPP